MVEEQLPPCSRLRLLALESNAGFFMYGGLGMSLCSAACMQFLISIPIAESCSYGGGGRSGKGGGVDVV